MYIVSLLLGGQLSPSLGPCHARRQHLPALQLGFAQVPRQKLAVIFPAGPLSAAFISPSSQERKLCMAVTVN